MEEVDGSIKRSEKRKKVLKTHRSGEEVKAPKTITKEEDEIEK